MNLVTNIFSSLAFSGQDNHTLLYDIAGWKHDCTQGWDFLPPQKNLVCYREGEEDFGKSSKGTVLFYFADIPLVDH